MTWLFAARIAFRNEGRFTCAKSQLFLAKEVYTGNGLEQDSMPTAIASYLTLSGFVIAADGNVTDDCRNITGRTAQKIFPVAKRPIAYSLYGYVSIGNSDEESPI